MLLSLGKINIQQHQGEEAGVVLEGEIEITIGAESRVLKAGRPTTSRPTSPTAFATRAASPAAW